MAFGDEYIERIKKIWTLTEPPLAQYTKETGLYERFCAQYEKARELCAQNRLFFRANIQNLLESAAPLSDMEASDLSEFCKTLSGMQDLEMIDRVLCIRIKERLLTDCEQKGDRLGLLRNLVSLAVLEFYMTQFLLREQKSKTNEPLARYTRSGHAHLRRVLEWFPKEKFAQLNDKEKSLTINACRLESLFMIVTDTDDVKMHHRQIMTAQNALREIRDPERRALYPAFDWVLEEASCLYYLAICGETMKPGIAYCEGDVQAACDAAYEQAEWMKAGKKPFVSQDETDRMKDYADYLTGKITTDEYVHCVSGNYDVRDITRYDAEGITTNLLVPAKILDVLLPMAKKNQTYAKQCEQMYKSILQYALYMPNNASQELFLNYTLVNLEMFCELPGGTTFAQMSDTLLANCSPSTYIHSQMVGRIAQTLADAMLDSAPERFIGLEGCVNVQQVHIRRARILHFIYECGLYHDVGKLPYLDTIGVTYRKLFDEEMEIVQLHPMAGYLLLREHPSTEKYAQAAFGHHKWYDETHGYPAEYHRADAEFPLIADIIAVADCMDAATDTVFRSYNKGISLDSFIKEAEAGAGTRYNPDVVALLAAPDMEEALQTLLTKGREEAYLCAYKLYRSQTGTGVSASTEKNVPVTPPPEQPKEEVGVLFERVLDEIEKGAENPEKMRTLVLEHIGDERVRNVYIPRFAQMMDRQNNTEGKVVAGCMQFWLIYTQEIAQAVLVNAESIRLCRTLPDYRHRPVYLSLLNNDVLGNIMRKDYPAAYRSALEELQLLNEKMTSLTFYCALLNNTSLILTDVGLMDKAKKQLQESMAVISQVPMQSNIATRYRYAELLMSTGDYAQAQEMYLNLLYSSRNGWYVEPWMIQARLVVLAFRQKNGIALRYWHDELSRSLADPDVPPENSSSDSTIYAEAVYASWTGDDAYADECYTKLLTASESTFLEVSQMLRDAAEFYDSYGHMEKSHPLYVRLDRIHRDSMRVVDELTNVENEMAQQAASRAAGEEMFEKTRSLSLAVQTLAACVSCDEIMDTLASALPAFMQTDAFLLLTRAQDGVMTVYPAQDGHTIRVKENAPEYPQLHVSGDQPDTLALESARCELFPQDVLVHDGTLLRVPLMYRGALMGLLLVYSAHPAAYNRQTLDAAATVGAGAAIALKNISRYAMALSKANKDPLTGICNRAGFQAEMIAYTRDERDEYALIMLDIDDFKQINDTYGHDAGDRVLMKLADILSHLRGNVLPARYGGEEFLLLVTVSKKDTLSAIGRKLCNAVEKAVFFEEQTSPVTISAGACVWHRDLPLAEMVKRADEQLYKAKNAGKNRLFVRKET